MKKLTVMLLAAVMCISISGCGEEPETPDMRTMGRELTKGVSEMMAGGVDAKDEHHDEAIEKYERNKKAVNNIFLEDPDEGSIDVKYYYIASGDDARTEYGMMEPSKDGKTEKLVLEFEYTNLSDRNKSAQMFFCYVTAYQDDVELDRDSFLSLYDDGDLSRSVRKGGKVTARITYALRNTDSDVDLVLSDAYGRELAEGTLKIK